MTIKDLKPQNVWNIFYGLTQVPRPSKHEEKIQEYLLNWGKERGIETFRDKTGNIIMRKPATPGYENRRGVIIQGHMDMVPQKNAEVKHDFEKDPIKTKVINGEWVGAEGTTLGADNGIGVAIGMAIMEAKDLKHGPVELLVTYDEETGMTGANLIEPNILHGDILLNLDSEEEGELCIGCAGGLDGKATFTYKELPTPQDCKAYRIGIKGLHGGHSGMDIKFYYANANKILARVLLPLIENYGVKLSHIKGGSLRNAIPFEGEAVILVPSKYESEVEKVVKEIFEEVKFETQYSDPNGIYTYEKHELPSSYIDENTTLRLVKAVLASPHGVAKMSDTMQGLTETSVNLAIIRQNAGKIELISLMRSAIDSSKYFLAEQLRAVYELAGAEFETSGGYVGWTPKPETPVYAVINDVYKKLFGEDMKIMATHGGLECAILGETYPHWEMASVGPTIVHPHSPDERVNIKAVENCWNLVLGILEAIPEK